MLGYNTITSKHEIFEVVFDNMSFVILVNVHGGKKWTIGRKWAVHYTQFLRKFYAICVVLYMLSTLTVEKGDFLLVVKFQGSKDQFFVNLSSIFSAYNFLLKMERLFLLSTFKEERFDINMRSLSGLKKRLYTFLRNYRFLPFLAT